MKIQKIKISSIRGIPNDFERELNCKSLVITGDNGTGKSGLIDAVDFLLTGRIKRLSGEGTKDISQGEYGHHIDKTPKEARVEAIVEFKGKTLCVERKLIPNNLKRLNGEKEAFGDLKSFLETGQFSLSRRELLKFIICTDQDRSKAIQELLDISEIEKVRTAIDQSYKTQETEKNTLLSDIKSNTLFLKQGLGLEFSAEEVDIRKKINEYREKLKADKITQWDQSSDILKDIHFETASSNISLTKNKFEQSISFLTQKNEPLKEEKIKLTEIIKKIIKIESFEELTKTNDLIELGMELLTNNTCPLCDTDWKERDLIGYLKDKLKEAGNAIQLKEAFENVSKKIVIFLEDYLSNLKNVLALSKKVSNELKKELETSITFTQSRINLYKNISNRKDLLSKN